MTPEQRLRRAERILVRLARSGREARREFREKINILIDAQIRNEEIWRVKSEAVNEQIKALAVAQVDLAKSQKVTDQALRAFLNGLQKGQNGKAWN